MAAMNDRIYISDLDMTLLNSEGALSRFARENINRFVGHGIHFTVASARSVKSIQPILEGVDLRLPIVNFNGAFISDLESGEHAAINALDPSSKAIIQHTLRKHERSYFLSTYDGVKDRLYYPYSRNFGEEWYVNDRVKKGDPRLTFAEDIEGRFEEEVVCVTIIDEKEKLEPLLGELSTCGANIEMHFQDNVYSRGWFWLTLQSNMATKDQGISSLLKQCELEGLQVTAFGDNTNDIKMLKNAGKGIAVANACDELKEVADEVIGSNDEDSVIRYIARENDLEFVED